MDKFESFFVEGQILSKEEYDTLKQHASFNAILSNDPNNKITIETWLDSPLPVELFKRIEQEQKKLFNQVSINIKTKKHLSFSKELIKGYLNYFITDKINASVILKTFLVNAPIITNDDGTIIIEYFNDAELQEIKRVEVLLKSFFNSFCLECKKIEYQIDKNKQNYELDRKRKLEQSIIAQRIVLNSALGSVRRDNDLSKARTTPINELVLEKRNDTIEGRVFEKDSIKTKNNKSIFKFSIADNTGAITIKAFAGVTSTKFRTINLPENYLDSIKNGDYVKARIELTNDQFQNNELTGIINKIYVQTNVDNKPKDDAPIKRVELLARTKMSAFDGLISPIDLVKRSKDYGWDAISVIDRFNVQSFPDAMRAGDTNKQKIIYGVEVDLLDRQIPIVVNPKQGNLSNESYVIFDLETTGLCAEFEDIIEFGAVKAKNGVIIDKIDMFIKPSKPIPAKIVELTRINDAMLENAKTIKQALKEILAWIGDATLIAHNGINFDLRFLNKKLVQNGFEPIKNTLIDTMQLSRSVHKDLTRHSLGTICKKYRIEYSEDIAHRADFDAEVLYRVWRIIQNQLSLSNVKDINQLNALQCESLYTRQFPTYVEVYIKNQQGIRDIYELISYSYTKNLFGIPRIFKDELKAKRSNFIIASSPYEGDIWDIAINGSDEELIKAINFYDYIFVAPPVNLLHEIDAGNITQTQIKKIIKKIISFSANLNKKVVAVSDAYYLDKEDQEAHKVYVNSKLLGGKRHRLFKYESKNDVLPDLHLRTTNELIKEFSFLQDENTVNEIVVDNSNEFAKTISDNIRPLQKGLFAPKIEEVNEKLQAIVWTNAKNIYGDPLPELIQKRIEKELNGIISNNYGIIYWISHLLVKKSLDDGYLVGSRGSVGSSIVAYFANISEVNPLPPHYICPHCKTSIFSNDVDDGYDLPEKLCPKCGKVINGNGHNIPFETFLGFKGEKVPDIDLNFSGEYQPKAHEFIRDMFGKDHTFRAGTIATVASKTAYGYVMNYYESLQLEVPKRQAEINWIVNKCVDVKRTTGQHPGGIIIVPKEMSIFDFSPYNYPADDKTQTWFTSHFAFENLHDNLLKFDILGHDDPTILKMLERLTNVNPKHIPFHDGEVSKLFTSLESLKIHADDFLGQKIGTAGLPEFGTDFVREMLARAKPQTFADLIRISGLSHGTDVWLNNAVDLISKMNMKLSEVISCRDDIMLTLIKKGVDSSTAFNVMESVRKGKGIKPDDEKILTEKGIEQWYIDSCKKIKYLFPKAHATAYVIMAWRIAWYKIHYPLAFYAAYFSIRTEVFDIPTITSGIGPIKEKIILIRKMLNNPGTKKLVKVKDKDLLPVYEVALELYLRGFKIAKPDLYKSKANEFVIEGNSIIAPFNTVDQLGEAGAQSIVEARKQSPFTSKMDLINRTKISSTILDTLDELGVLDGLDEDNQMSLF